jgi:hypothetical protein
MLSQLETRLKDYVPSQATDPFDQVKGSVSINDILEIFSIDPKEVLEKTKDLRKQKGVPRDVQIARAMVEQGVLSDADLQGQLGDELRAERAPIIAELAAKGYIKLCDFTWEAPVTGPNYPCAGMETIPCTLPKGHVGGPNENTLRHAYEGPKGSAIYDVPITFEPQSFKLKRFHTRKEDCGAPIDNLDCTLKQGHKGEHLHVEWLDDQEIPLRGWGLKPGAGFDHKVATKNLELPEEIRNKRELYEQFYRDATIKDNIDPEKLMEYWKTLPEAKKCVDSKRLRLGVTDDHLLQPLITWTSLARSKSCPGFHEWWGALPEATPYDRSKVSS